MDSGEIQALKNSAKLAAIALTRSEPISPDEVLRVLRRPLPDPRDLEDYAIIAADYKHWVTNAGITGARRVVSYKEASKLTGKSQQAIRQAAHRGQIRKTTERWRGRETVGVYLDSLAEWAGWSLDKWRRAARRIDKARAREVC